MYKVFVLLLPSPRIACGYNGIKLRVGQDDIAALENRFIMVKFIGMIKFYYRNKKQKKVKELAEYTKGAWIYVVNPNSKEIDYLVDEFSLEEGHIKDALDVNEVPRIELENGTVYIFTRYAVTENDKADTVPILIVIKKNALITISQAEFERLDRLLSEKHDFTTTQNVTLFIKLFSQITHSFNQHLNAVTKKVHVSQVTIENIKNRDIIQFITIENTLNDFILSLVRSNSILNNILNRKILYSTGEEQDQIEDLALYNNQLVQIANENLRSLINIREAYATITTSNLNRIIKLFTSLTVILTLPTIISSFYGMNV